MDLIFYRNKTLFLGRLKGFPAASLALWSLLERCCPLQAECGIMELAACARLHTRFLPYEEVLPIAAPPGSGFLITEKSVFPP